MKDKKYIELIHKSIDGTISPKEKVKLDKYFKTNSKAEVLYKQLLRTEELLNEIKDHEPSVNLRKRILNSIDYSLYADEKKKSTANGYFSKIFAGSPIKIATSIAAILIIVGVLLSAILYSSYFNSLTENENVYGTIGISQPVLLKSVKVDTANVSGKIDLRKGSKSYDFNIQLNSLEKYSLRIEFDPNHITFNDSSMRELKNIRIERGAGFINLTSSNAEPYNLAFFSNDPSPEKFSLKIYKGKNKIIEKEVFLSK